METCDAPDDKPEDAYLVQEISFVEAGKAWQEWPFAILVSDMSSSMTSDTTWREKEAKR